MTPVIDIHTHCLSGGRTADEVAQGLLSLNEEGLARLLLIMSPPFSRNPEEMVAMYPDVARHVAARSDDFEVPFGLKVFDALGPRRSLVTAYIGFHTYFPDVARGAPFEPVRAVLDELGDVVGGLKIHYFRPAPDHPMAQQFGGGAWDQDRFDAFTVRVLAEARERQLPAVIHVDLREGGRAFVDLIRPFSDVTLCLCHFGYSRRLCGELLEELPWLVTDMSGIELHASMYARLPAYHDFVTRFPDRVLYGSDQYICDTAELRKAWDLVDALELSDDVAEQVRYGNAERFLRQEPHPGVSRRP
ncbi:MAG: amidohydrolase family protein [Actinomycetota bacterium]